MNVSINLEQHLSLHFLLAVMVQQKKKKKVKTERKMLKLYKNCLFSF